MRDYIYDGTFEGLLCCVYAHYYQDKALGIYMPGDYQQSLLGSSEEIETDVDKAMRVYHAIEKKISVYDLKRVYRVFLSCTPDKEMKILNYLQLGFHVGAKISSLQGEQCVYEIQQAAHKVSREIDRMAGLIRFSVLEGDIMYAAVEPDNDLLELIGGHFSDRFKNNPFIIHDKKRKKALLAKGGSWYISHFDQADLPELSRDELGYRALWKKYFETIAIKERINPRCQKAFMPVRYWKNLTEMI